MTTDMVDGNATRDRMVAGTAELLGRAGVAETSLRNLVAATGAPRGSIYHHFPGGKDELVAEAIHLVGGRLVAALRSTPVASAADVVVAFAGLFRRLLGMQSGCAVTAVATSADAAALGSAARVFAARRRELSTKFAAAGVEADRDGSLAALTVAAVEGALVQARAAGDVDLFDAAIVELVASLDSLK